MGTSSVKHLAPEFLRALGAGQLDDNTSAWVWAHLEGCAECHRAASALLGESVLQRLRGQRPTTGHTPVAVNPADTSSPAAPVSLTLNTSGGAIPVLPELIDHPQYEVQRELGRGGMGVVYLARNKLMDRLEVLKVVNKRLLDHPGAAERFLREIRSAAKLSHANIVTAYSAMQLGELLAFAMEYIDGDNLAQVVQARGPLPIVNACYYIQQAAQGLQHAFEKGMVHRDVKPHNLILAREGKKHVVKVLDFGLAKATREKDDNAPDLTGTGAMLGTPDYIAPEQTMDAASADIRADIYSLGCTLYYLLTGKPPFQARSHFELLIAHNTQQAEPLNQVRTDVPPELAAVVAKMMAKDPAQRYQKPGEVTQALTPFVKSGLKPLPAGQASPIKNVVPDAAKTHPQRPTPSAEKTQLAGNIFEMPTQLPGQPEGVTELKPSPRPRPTRKGGAGKDARETSAPARSNMPFVLLGLGVAGLLAFGMLGVVFVFAVGLHSRAASEDDRASADPVRSAASKGVVTEAPKPPSLEIDKPKIDKPLLEEPTKEPLKPKEEPPAQISRENYNKLKLGMTLKEVEEILGKGTTATNAVLLPALMRNYNPSSPERTWRLTVPKGRCYSWQEGKTIILVNFCPNPLTTGKVDALCFSLDGYGHTTGNPLNVTVERFEKLKVGMTLKEVEEIMGEGKLATASDARSAFFSSRFNQTTETAFARAAQQERVYIWKEEPSYLLVAFAGTPVAESKVEAIWFGPSAYGDPKRKPEDKWVTRRDNFGKLTLGMTLAEMEAILGGGEEATAFVLQYIPAWSKAAKEGRVWIWRTDTYTVLAGFPGNPKEGKVEALYEGSGGTTLRERGALSGTK